MWPAQGTLFELIIYLAFGVAYVMRLLSAALSFTLSAGLQFSHIVLVMCTMCEAILSFPTAPMGGWVPSVALTRLSACYLWAVSYVLPCRLRSPEHCHGLQSALSSQSCPSGGSCLPGSLWGWRAGSERVRGILDILQFFSCSGLDSGKQL